jgi:hypothetical protein
MCAPKRICYGDKVIIDNSNALLNVKDLEFKIKSINMKKSTIILCGILCLNLASVFAADPPPSPKEAILAMDLNKDNKISKTEAKGILLEHFHEIDSNKDGFLTELELNAMKTKKEDMDTNKDGKISKSEAKGPLLEHFNLIDTNKDGFLTDNELKAYGATQIGK